MTSSAPVTQPVESPRPAPEGLWTRLFAILEQPVSGASLAVFRIAFGIIMCLEAYTLCAPSAMIAGAPSPLETYYTASNIRFHFPYALFSWLPVLPPGGMRLMAGLLALGGVGLILGFKHRISALLVFLSWGYFYALESTRTYWMSYYYLELLIAFLLIWMPASASCSIDRKLAKVSGPGIIPYWPLFLLRAQLVITYFYAGIAKLNADWLLDAMPVRYYLMQPHVSARVHSFFSERTADWVTADLQDPSFAYFISWTGAAFDLAVGFLLLFRRTRIFGLSLMLIFHGTNHFLIFKDLEWFPLVGILTSFIFLDPDWPQRAWKWLRKPFLKTPDWKWFVPGALLFPGIGAALGWKLNRTSNGIQSIPRFNAGRFTAALVVFWIVFQGLFPLRGYLIPGDARFTFEGLSFSWRLKAEVYRASPCEIEVTDPGIITAAANGKPQIHWDQWQGKRVLFRQVTPGKINWAVMPELLVTFDPIVGDRVLYNPYSGQTAARSEEESMQRVQVIWKELFGREPQLVRRTISLPKLLEGYSKAIQSKGGPVITNPREQLAYLDAVHGRGGSGQIIPLLRRMDPFATLQQGELVAPFLAIDDPQLFKNTGAKILELDAAQWPNSTYSRQLAPHPVDENSAPALVVYLQKPPMEEHATLPSVYLTDSLDTPDTPPFIYWDYLRDLTISQAMHTSTQPFLLKRYVERIADLWRKEYGREPEVRANTGLSLNLRPLQPIVDSRQDLVRAPRSYFSHNAWVNDLEIERIPREALEEALGKLDSGDTFVPN